MIEQLFIEVTADDEAGFVAFAIDVGTDAVLHVSNSFKRPEEAEAAARVWIERNQ